MGKQGKQWQTIFLGSKITADGDCNHEIKRCLLLGRKAMTKPDNILKSRDITFATNIHLVKAMVFPVQFGSVAQSCPTLCDPMNCSTPGLPVHHQLLEFTQTYVHQVSDAIQPSHPLSSPFPPALSIPPSIRVFSNESILRMMWPNLISYTIKKKLLQGVWLSFIMVVVVFPGHLCWPMHFLSLYTP